MSSSLFINTLDLKKNVFVTQLGVPEEEEEYGIRKFPVLHEEHKSVDKNGKRPLQSTLLLQKQQEMLFVDQELESKRREFAVRMEKCMRKQDELRLEQKKIKERVEKFDRFVRDNELKRQRALQKYNSEKKQLRLREDELESLLSYYEQLVNKQEELTCTIEVYKKFKNYIQQVVDILPEGYLELSDNMVNGVISRYNTLQQTNKLLLTELIAKDDSIDKAQQLLCEITKKKSDEMLAYNSTIAALHSKLDKCYQRAVRKEEIALQKKRFLREQYQLYGQLELAIQNLVERCTICKKKPKSLISQLSVIQTYLLEREAIYRMSLASGTTTPTTLSNKY